MTALLVLKKYGFPIVRTFKNVIIKRWKVVVVRRISVGLRFGWTKVIARNYLDIAQARVRYVEALRFTGLQSEVNQLKSKTIAQGHGHIVGTAVMWWSVLITGWAGGDNSLEQVGKFVQMTIIHFNFRTYGNKMFS